MRLVENGLGVPIFNHQPGKCRVIPGIECGSEDLAVTKDGLAFISNGLRLIPKCDYSQHKGNVYLFNFNNPKANVSRLEIRSETIDLNDFDPHGLSLWEHTDDPRKISIFLVDHAKNAELIHIFEYNRDNPGTLAHKESIKSDKFVCINDVVATGPHSFYVTNFLAFCQVSHAALFFEMLFKMKTGNIVYFDGKEGRIVGNGYAMSNGINLSPDGKHLYLATSTSKQLLIFNRNIETNEVTLVKELPLMTSPDNIEIDKDNGDIYIGCHKDYKLPFANYNGTFVAPSQVLRIRCPKNDFDECKIIEVLSSDGVDFVSGSSVAHRYKGGLLIGTVYHRLGYCEGVNIS